MRKWRLIGCTAFVLVTAVVLAVAATLLPDNPYQRFQQLDGTIYGNDRWSYERIHFDPRPIDVAIVGDSKSLIGLSAVEIERRLAEHGKQVSVANMSLEGAGRNVQWIFVQELLKTKRPSVIVLAVNEQPHPWGHDSFRYIAPASEVWREASYGLHDAKKNLMYLPFRQLRLFAAKIFPGFLGLQDRFDAARYAATPTGFPDRHKNQAGEWIDLRQTSPREKLLREADQYAGEFGKHSKLPPAVRAVTDADDRIYTELIARAAAEHGVKLLFVYQPAFYHFGPITNRRFYEALGPLQDNSDLADRDTLFYDWSHVNTGGATIVSDRVADALAKMLR
ncbi:MAG TPA: hypothetical protein VGH86_16400 [Phenylobacterium sp.]|jgi:hypothetical protein